MNFTFNLFSFVLGLCYSLILDLSVLPIRIKWRKACNYNCNECKVWDCPKHRCDYLRSKNNGSNN